MTDVQALVVALRNMYFQSLHVHPYSDIGQRERQDIFLRLDAIIEQLGVDVSGIAPESEPTSPDDVQPVESEHAPKHWANSPIVPY